MIALLALSLAAGAPNPAGHAAPPHPLQPLANYIHDTDYPREALRMGVQGIVRFSLGIAPDGQVADCTVTASAGDPALDLGTCDLMRARARFQPATDAHGQPVEGRFDGSITWNILSLTSPYPIGEMIAFTVLRVTPAGAATCTVSIAGTIVERRDGDCGDLAQSGAADAMRRLRRDAELHYQFEVLRPDMYVSQPPTRGLIAEREVMLTVDDEGRVTNCERRTERNGQPLEGLGPLPDLCLYRPPTQNRHFPIHREQPGGYQERIHAFAWLREPPHPPALR